MGSRNMALRLVLSAFIVCLCFSVLVTSQSSDEAIQQRRIRLRNLFSKRRRENGAQGVTIRNEEKNDNNEEERTPTVRKIVTVSSSSSSSSSRTIPKRFRPKTKLARPTVVKSENKVEPAAQKKETKLKTQRKRFRLVKNPQANQDELLEKILSDLDLKNDIVQRRPGLKKRPFRFRPLNGRNQIRKNTNAAIKNTAEPETTTGPENIEQTTVVIQTTSATTIREGEPEKALVSEDDIISRTTEDIEVNTIRNMKPQPESTTTTTSRPQVKRRLQFKGRPDRVNLFRQNSPRRFSFGRRPPTTEITTTTTTELPETESIVEELKKFAATTSQAFSQMTFAPETEEINNKFVSKILPKPEDNEIITSTDDQKFSSFPAFARKPATASVTTTEKFVPVVFENTQIVPVKQASKQLPQLDSLAQLASVTKSRLKQNKPNGIVLQRNQQIFSPNSIIQPAFTKPFRAEQPQVRVVPETQRSIAREPKRPVPLQITDNNFRQNNNPQVLSQTVTSAPVFPSFELPDFFKVPFSAFQTDTSQPEGRGSYSIQW